MRWISTLAAATLLTLAAGQVQAGPLTGQSLTIDWGATPPTAVVGSGIEFSTFTINWDFGEDGSLTISVHPGTR